MFDLSLLISSQLINEYIPLLGFKLYYLALIIVNGVDIFKKKSRRSVYFKNEIFNFNLISFYFILFQLFL